MGAHSQPGNVTDSTLEAAANDVVEYLYEKR
jgi:hypothetical protein